MKKYKLKNDMKKHVERMQGESEEEYGFPLSVKQVMEEIADWTGMSVDGIQSLYYGRSEPSIGTALRIADFFDTTVEEIFTLESYDPKGAETK